MRALDPALDLPPGTTAAAWVEPHAAHAALTHFVVHAEVLLGGGGEADGMSVVYGPPTTQPFGEMGIEHGLVRRPRRPHPHPPLTLALTLSRRDSHAAPSPLHPHRRPLTVALAPSPSR